MAFHFSSRTMFFYYTYYTNIIHISCQGPPQLLAVKVPKSDECIAQLEREAEIYELLDRIEQVRVSVWPIYFFTIV